MSRSDIDILKSMTLKELWELFPITLVPHNPEWYEWANHEMQFLSKLLDQFKPTINHIGSTAIPGIMAKPIVDIIIEISTTCDWLSVKRTLEDAEYICMSESVGRMSFNKGYTPSGYAKKVFHIHIHENGDNDEIKFRDYLRNHSDIAKEYETLKLSLLPKFRNNRDGYTEAKAVFVKRVLSLESCNGNLQDDH